MAAKRTVGVAVGGTTMTALAGSTVTVAALKKSAQLERAKIKTFFIKTLLFLDFAVNIAVQKKFVKRERKRKSP
jgi:hypothetical protein